jgi:hypothetical protein
MASETIQWQREVPVRHTVDVFVAGGGPAGLAAAVTAARQGRSVFLAEGQSCFGGMGTAGLVPAFMRFTDGEHWLAGGFGREVYDGLKAMGAPLPWDEPAGTVSIHAESLKRLYDGVMEACGAGFAFATQVTGVEARGAQLQHAVCWGKSGFFAVRAACFVDATGDGDLAAWAGAPFEKGDEEGRMMPGTLCSLWSDIDWESWDRADSAQQDGIEQAYEEGVLSVKDLHLPGMWRVGEHLGGGNIGHTYGVDHTDERSVTEALLWGRKLVQEYAEYYRRCVGGSFAQMELAATGALLGIRETRRILGDYTLCLEDFKARASFEDEIGRYAYPVDIHASTPGDESYGKFLEEFHTLRYGPGESYGIPYRCLTPQGLDNVLVAGRCISTDRFLQGSVRVMPGCYITGQAAGMAAALCAEKDCDTRGVRAAELRERLAAAGAYLPEPS